jgi:PTH1 family peptidyl-tRNA hydrolase
MRTHSARLDHWLNSPPQTNEVQRSAVLIAAGHVLAARYALPIALSELGASGGLNLMWDHFALRIGTTHYGPARPALTLTPEWHSNTLPPQSTPHIVERRGVDLNPLNPRNPKDALRLNAYLWPDQTDRLTRSRAAIAVAQGIVDKGDAADWLKPRLALPMPGRLHLIYHTIAWQYFPSEVSARARHLIETAGTKATDAAPIAWLAMEDDGKTPGAGLTLRLWPGDVTLDLGRADFHGRWLDWRSPET